MPELIKFDFVLGLKVNVILEEIMPGFEKRKDQGGFLSFEFTQDELDQIKRLDIINPRQGELKDLKYFRNLESLSVRTMTGQRSEYTHISQTSSISQEEMYVIESMTTLKQLQIHNQTKIHEIDISKLVNLEYVEVMENQELESVKGIDVSPSLYGIKIVGNENLPTVENLAEVIKKNEILTLDLDLMLFPCAMGYKNGTCDAEAQRKIEEIGVACVWRETVTNKASAKINTYRAWQMHQKAMEIVTSIDTFDIYGRIAAVEAYISQNVIYSLDKDGNVARRAVDNGLVEGPLHGTNGTYNAIMYNSCVCQGYARMEKYLLQLLGIRSREVHCIGGNSEYSKMADKAAGFDRHNDKLPKDGFHSILYIADVCLYSDPCWSAGQYQNTGEPLVYSLLNKDQMAQVHSLSYAEANVSSVQALDRAHIQAYIDRAFGAVAVR